MPSVAACLITKNEAAHLPYCLASLAGHVDEIILVDTGSQDETVSIARNFGCAVSELPWRNDFSEARNHGLDRATANWILYIDADERLSSATSLKEVIPDSGAAAAKVRFYPRLDTTAYGEYRLFRRDPRIRFTGSMHETMLPGIRRVCAEDGLAVAELFDVTITHHGYEGDQSRKHARNLPLLEKAIEADPTRIYLRYHLGLILRDFGRREEAAGALLAGIDLAFVQAGFAQSRVEGSLCAFVLGEMRLRDGALAEALAIAERGAALFPENRALDFVKAQTLFALGRQHESLSIASQLAACDPETLFDPHLAYPKRLFGLACFDLMGSIHFKMKNFEEAALCFDRALAVQPGSIEYRAKADLARARASRKNSPPV